MDFKQYYQKAKEFQPEVYAAFEDKTHREAYVLGIVGLMKKYGISEVFEIGDQLKNSLYPTSSDYPSINQIYDALEKKKRSTKKSNTITQITNTSNDKSQI